MISRGLLQPLSFCESVILYSVYTGFYSKDTYLKDSSTYTHIFTHVRQTVLLTKQFLSDTEYNHIILVLVASLAFSLALLYKPIKYLIDAK